MYRKVTGIFFFEIRPYRAQSNYDLPHAVISDRDTRKLRREPICITQSFGGLLFIRSQYASRTQAEGVGAFVKKPMPYLLYSHASRRYAGSRTSIKSVPATISRSPSAAFFRSRS